VQRASIVKTTTKNAETKLVTMAAISAATNYLVFIVSDGSGKISELQLYGSYLRRANLHEVGSPSLQVYTITRHLRRTRETRIQTHAQIQLVSEGK
jgi:hypothetical protein